MKVDTWFSDDPAADLAGNYGRGQFLEATWAVLRQAQSIKSSTVFGLVGPWGSGKSSMLQWLQRKAEAESDLPWNFVRFNPWDFQDDASLQTGFIAELSGAFESSPLKKAREALSAFARSVAPLTSIAGFLGVDPSHAVEGFAKLLDGDRSVARARAALEAALEEAEVPTLVVIDDLDRVSADELLLTLKLVRQIGRLPHVHYLLSYDEQTLIDVLSHTSLVGRSSASRARDYLEKVVQARFDVPALRPIDVRALVNLELAELSTSGTIRISEADAARFSSAFFAFLAARLSTPRAINRYFAQVRMVSPGMLGEVDNVDYLVLSWLRTAEPGAYALIQRHRDELVGAPYFGGSRTDDAESKARVAKWRSRLIEGGTRDSEVEGVASAIGFLFPRFSYLWSSSTSDSEPAKPLRLAHESYFDRYFSFGLPPEDIADAVVERALSDLAAGEAGSSAVTLVELAAISNADAVLEKVARGLERESRSSRELFDWLANLWSSMPAKADAIRPGARLESALSARLRTLDESLVTVYLQSLAAHVSLLLNTLDTALRPQRGSEFRLLESQTRMVRDVVRQELLREGSSPSAIRSELRPAVWAWSRLDPSGFSDWFEAQRIEHGDLNALGFFVQSYVTLGAKRAPYLSYLDFEEASKFFELDELRRTYSAEILTSPELSSDRFEGPPDTPQNRVDVALASLRIEPNPDSP
ncbi:KAP family P-loop NTPase fold protein [Schumannella soli]|uniref:KAP NTPase domain-containing protein n=1 Tax=Schumannella soli TaxID=2590779 RepID=A0A506XNG5_9MICO|nr:P-loop NTPase fold protein [Schumannella soli]TPW74204.1 hypothetical protein FJ657_16380 [Schumannella soli]